VGGQRAGGKGDCWRQQFIAAILLQGRSPERICQIKNPFLSKCPLTSTH